MSKTSKKRVVAGSAIIALGLMFAGVGISKAATTNGNANPMSNLVSAIATKFNLNVSDVQAVVDAQMAADRESMQKDMEQRFNDRLTQAVKDGKITQDQADKISAKKTELESLRASIEGKTEDERRAAMKTQVDTLKKWATDNNIPAEFLMFGGPHMGGHMGHGMMMSR